jgi:hypothetical protein
MPLKDSSKVKFLVPWVAVEEGPSGLEKELYLELGINHPLFGRKLRALARRQDCDDVLFVGDEEPGCIAVVHLTWSRPPEQYPPYPRTTMFKSMDAWIEYGMMVDHGMFR